MSKQIARFKTGDMFRMEPDSRIIVTSVDNSISMMGFYHISHVIQDRVTDTKEHETWTFEKLNLLVDRSKLVFVCNIFDIKIFPITQLLFLDRRVLELSGVSPGLLN